MWEVASGKSRGTFEELGLCSVAFSADGKLIAAGSGAGMVYYGRPLIGPQLKSVGRHRKIVATVAISRDGRTMASASHDGVVGLWEVPPEAPEALPLLLTEGELARLWGELGDDNAIRAFQAIRTLTRTPEQTATLFDKHFQPASIPPAVIEPDGVARLIKDLEADEFPVREKASEELEKIGRPILAALQKALDDKPPLESRRRLRLLVEKLTPNHFTPDELRIFRGIEVLEYLGTPRARQKIQSLAGGVPQALMTREAQASLTRLARLPARPTE
jgi:hypothetical protein